MSELSLASSPAATPAAVHRPGSAGLSWGELAVPGAVLAVVLAMIAPVPAWGLDLLISANIAASVLVLLVSLYITRPVEFSVFPTLLLLLTLFRLALNISSSRLILLNGNTGTAAAGHVIEAFGNFVVGGNFIVGVVIFLVLIAIQYVVINHGAVRISEVTARFTLDALPGKQMSIDSDLNAGLIDEAEARRRRKALAAEAEFYGAMDGASRFTQRDAVASIIITGINIIAGFLIGVLQHGLELGRALQTYSVLTIGDGLVTVIPALMISISGGLIVTRASSDNRLGRDIGRQVLADPQPLFLGSAVLLLLAAFPGLPGLPFLALAAGCGAAGMRLRRARPAGAPTPAPAPRPTTEDLESLLKVEPLAIEVGLGLVKLVEGGANSPLLRRIAAIRRQLAAELGYIFPPVRVTDNLSLKAREYVILLKGVEIARYELASGCELALLPRTSEVELPGTPTREPAFGLPAVWVPSDQAEPARAAGATLVDSVSVVATHLTELLRTYAWELFSRQDARKFLDRAAEQSPKLVEDLVPKLLPLATVHKVLQNLLRERVPIRDACTILEALSEAAAMTRNPILLTEFVRQAIRRTIVKPYLGRSGDLAAYLLDPGLEKALESGVEHGEHSSHLNLPPSRLRALLEAITRVVRERESSAVLLTSSVCRPFVRQMVESALPNLAVLSHNELPPGVRVLSLGVISAEAGAGA